MAESASFLGTTNHTEATDNAAKARVQKNGYLVGVEDELEVIENTPQAMNVIVGTGEAWVQGVQYINDAAKTVTVDAADATHPRIDRIVLRLTWAADTLEAVYLKGTAAAPPTAPALTQSSAVWELSLCQILVTVGKTSIVTTDITDERNTSYCGQAACNLGTAKINADGSLSMEGKIIHSVADPTSAQDAATKTYVDSAGFEIGDVKYSARSSTPSNWLLCDGSAISRTTYAALFSAIGTAFGAGNGTTTFNIPAGGKVPVGYLSGDADFGTLGATGGEKTHLLTGPESGIQAHTHPYRGNTSVGSEGGGPSSSGSFYTDDTSTTGPTNATTPHNNLQPFQVVNMFIKYA